MSEKALAAMVCWNRKEISTQTIESYIETGPVVEADLHVVDNGSNDGMAEWLKDNQERLEKHNVFCHFNDSNIGTANAINMIWKERTPTQHCMKIDSDMLWPEKGWFNAMLEVFDYTENVGIVALKREDLWESPVHPDPFYRTKILEIARQDGTSFRIEVAQHTLGSTWLVRSSLLNSIGALRQPGLYGFDDSLYCLRAKIAGYACAFVPDVPVIHNDKGEAGGETNAKYTRWKLSSAGIDMQAFEKLRDAYQSGALDAYEPFGTEGRNKIDFSYTEGQNRTTFREIEKELGENLFYE
jgi:GT2 family glycosyltransferase